MPKRSKEFLRGQVFPGFAAGLGGRVARLAVAKVGVRILRAKAARRRLIAQSPQDLSSVVADVLEQVTAMVRQSAAMAEQVSQPQVLA